MSFLLSQDTVCRRPSTRRAVADPSICCTSSVQVKGNAGLEDLDHTVPLGWLRISAQLSVRELCCLLDLLQLLWMFSSSLANLQISGFGFRALGLDVWMTGSTRARFQVQGESRTKGTSRCLREVLIHTSSFIVSGIRGAA